MIHDLVMINKTKKDSGFSSDCIRAGPRPVCELYVVKRRRGTKPREEDIFQKAVV